MACQPKCKLLIPFSFWRIEVSKTSYLHPKMMGFHKIDSKESFFPAVQPIETDHDGEGFALLSEVSRVLLHAGILPLA